MKLNNFYNGIFEVEGVIERDVARHLISLFDTHPFQQNPIQKGNNRDCKFINISDNENTNEFPPLYNVALNIFNLLIEKNIFHNHEPNYNLSIQGFELCKYEKDSKGFVNHFDGLLDLPNYVRHYTLNLFLSECKEPIYFPLQNFTYQPKKYTALIFPSGDFFQHEQKGPFTQEKYNVVTWIASKFNSIR